ncbi:hypothetical protein EYF80_052438 [Liparis tanakae]|uniref:Uncharacterized protein n=1 Tax=Liparis tanakae TaxID=230148 RepID=A0A4Z2F846_9TELE|nr:hypothetical protein EYF80_052438 [Liparis tanakae]
MLEPAPSGRHAKRSKEVRNDCEEEEEEEEEEERRLFWNYKKQSCHVILTPCYCRHKSPRVLVSVLAPEPLDRRVPLCLRTPGRPVALRLRGDANTKSFFCANL